MAYLAVWGKLIHEKIQKSKILWHCPFKRLKTLLQLRLFILLEGGGGGANRFYSYVFTKFFNKFNRYSCLPQVPFPFQQKTNYRIE